MNRADAGLLAVAPALLYASAVGVRAVAASGPVALLGVLAAVAPLVGWYRDELAVLGWLPGLFLAGVLFTVSGITVNPLPGALGDLSGGWATASPAFAGLALVAARRSPGRSVALLIVALLAAAAVLVVVAGGGATSASAFADQYVQIPRLQALALAAVLTGGPSAGAPFLSVPALPFDALALLAGAGGLALLLGVDPTSDPEALGHEGAPAFVPEGMYRSLLVEGRARLAEGSAPERPGAAEPVSLLSIVSAVAAAVAVLVVAADLPDRLVPSIAVGAIALLAVTLFYQRVRGTAAERERKRAAPGESV